MVGNTTLPPGKYDFSMMTTTNGVPGRTSMRVTNANGSTSVDFLVTPARNSHVPEHSDLVFDS